MDDFETDIPKMVLEALDTQNNTPSEKKKILIDRLHWLTFSDTVFVALPYDLSAKPQKIKFDLIFFTILAIYINRRMFEIGLPMRGAIHIGDVKLSRRCFAGKAIVEAHTLGAQFQAAVTAISEQANALIFNTFMEREPVRFLFSQSMVECDIPTGIKDVSQFIACNTSVKAKTLCWFYFKMGSIAPFNIPSDLHSYITGRFTANGKTLPSYKEKLKVANTVKLFKDWMAANHTQYEHEVRLKDQTHP